MNDRQLFIFANLITTRSTFYMYSFYDNIFHIRVHADNLIEGKRLSHKILRIAVVCL